MKGHTFAIIVRLLEEQIISSFGVPKYILINNDGEWMVGFDAMCKDFGITHQFTTPYWT